MEKFADKDGNTLLHMNITTKDAIDLIKKGANVNAKNKKGKQPLHNASDLDLVVALVENGADVIEVSTYYSPEIKTYLIQKGFPANNDDIMEFGTPEQKLKINVTPKMALTYFKYAKLYIEQKNDINAKMDNDGWTLLHYAVKKGDIERVRYLIDNGADQFVKDLKGNVPANIYSNRKEIYSILKDSINIPNNENKTLLFRLSTDIRLMEHLISLGAKTINDNGESIYDKIPDLKPFDIKLKELIKGREKQAMVIILDECKL
jgi:ankyrin repeat protein